ncbi:hypothetical protein GCM10018789_41030 [Streptomyces werraensis]|nr:hypothetical protein GCM10018789_41030 [Streptomyces werraensis]
MSSFGYDIARRAGTCRPAAPGPVPRGTWQGAMSRVARKDPAEQRPEPLTPDEEAVVRPLRRVIDRPRPGGDVDQHTAVALALLRHEGRARGAGALGCAVDQRPGRRSVISCTIQPLPSGSSKDRNEL